MSVNMYHVSSQPNTFRMGLSYSQPLYTIQSHSIPHPPSKKLIHSKRISNKRRVSSTTTDVSSRSHSCQNRSFPSKRSSTCLISSTLPPSSISSPTQDYVHPSGLDFLSKLALSTDDISLESIPEPSSSLTSHTLLPLQTVPPQSSFSLSFPISSLRISNKRRVSSTTTDVSSRSHSCQNRSFPSKRSSTCLISSTLPPSSISSPTQDYVHPSGLDFLSKLALSTDDISLESIPEPSSSLTSHTLLPLQTVPPQSSFSLSFPISSLVPIFKSISLTSDEIESSVSSRLDHSHALSHSLEYIHAKLQEQLALHRGSETPPHLDFHSTFDSIDSTLKAIKMESNDMYEESILSLTLKNSLSSQLQKLEGNICSIAKNSQHVADLSKFISSHLDLLEKEDHEDSFEFNKEVQTILLALSHLKTVFDNISDYSFSSIHSPLFMSGKYSFPHSAIKLSPLVDERTRKSFEKEAESREKMRQNTLNNIVKSFQDLDIIHHHAEDHEDSREIACESDSHLSKNINLQMHRVPVSPYSHPLSNTSFPSLSDFPSFSSYFESEQDTSSIFINQFGHFESIPKSDETLQSFSIFSLYGTGAVSTSTLESGTVIIADMSESTNIYPDDITERIGEEEISITDSAIISTPILPIGVSPSSVTSITLDISEYLNPIHYKMHVLSPDHAVGVVTQLNTNFHTSHIQICELQNGFTMSARDCFTLTALASAKLSTSFLLVQSEPVSAIYSDSSVMVVFSALTSSFNIVTVSYTLTFDDSGSSDLSMNILSPDLTENMLETIESSNIILSDAISLSDGSSSCSESSCDPASSDIAVSFIVLPSDLSDFFIDGGNADFSNLNYFYGEYFYPSSHPFNDSDLFPTVYCEFTFRQNGLPAKQRFCFQTTKSRMSKLFSFGESVFFIQVLNATFHTLISKHVVSSLTISSDASVPNTVEYSTIYLHNFTFMSDSDNSVEWPVSFDFHLWEDPDSLSDPILYMAFNAMYNEDNNFNLTSSQLSVNTYVFYVLFPANASSSLLNATEAGYISTPIHLSSSIVMEWDCDTYPILCLSNVPSVSIGVTNELVIVSSVLHTLDNASPTSMDVYACIKEDISICTSLLDTGFMPKAPQSIFGEPHTISDIGVPILMSIDPFLANSHTDSLDSSIIHLFVCALYHMEGIICGERGSFGQIISFTPSFIPQSSSINSLSTPSGNSLKRYVLSSNGYPVELQTTSKHSYLILGLVSSENVLSVGYSHLDYALISHDLPDEADVTVICSLSCVVYIQPCPNSSVTISRVSQSILSYSTNSDDDDENTYWNEGELIINLDISSSLAADISEYPSDWPHSFDELDFDTVFNKFRLSLPNSQYIYITDIDSSLISRLYFSLIVPECSIFGISSDIYVLSGSYTEPFQSNAIDILSTNHDINIWVEIRCKVCNIRCLAQECSPSISIESDGVLLSLENDAQGLAECLKVLEVKTSIKTSEEGEVSESDNPVLYISANHTGNYSDPIEYSSTLIPVSCLVQTSNFPSNLESIEMFYGSSLSLFDDISLSYSCTEEEDELSDLNLALTMYSETDSSKTNVIDSFVSILTDGCSFSDGILTGSVSLIQSCLQLLLFSASISGNFYLSLELEHLFLDYEISIIEPIQFDSSINNDNLIYYSLDINGFVEFLPISFISEPDSVDLYSIETHPLYGVLDISVQTDSQIIYKYTPNSQFCGNDMISIKYVNYQSSYYLFLNVYFQIFSKVPSPSSNVEYKLSDGLRYVEYIQEQNIHSKACSLDIGSLFSSSTVSSLSVSISSSSFSSVCEAHNPSLCEFGSDESSLQITCFSTNLRSIQIPIDIYSTFSSSPLHFCYIVSQKISLFFIIGIGITGIILLIFGLFLIFLPKFRTFFCSLFVRCGFCSSYSQKCLSQTPKLHQSTVVVRYLDELNSDGIPSKLYDDSSVIPSYLQEHRKSISNISISETSIPSSFQPRRDSQTTNPFCPPILAFNPEHLRLPSVFRHRGSLSSEGDSVSRMYHSARPLHTSSIEVAPRVTRSLTSGTSKLLHYEQGIGVHHQDQPFHQKSHFETMFSYENVIDDDLEEDSCISQPFDPFLDIEKKPLPPIRHTEKESIPPSSSLFIHSAPKPKHSAKRKKEKPPKKGSKLRKKQTNSHLKKKKSKKGN
ncbi:hypothetical protein ADUPG1_013058 [Aduncisulcus paluster]|uniref:Uncharacterized protein n=1 Tax=Aduncisulcus paluster TaxID=2918883 RepID=A0ABQ5K3L2_9EUKA|nr:hypothetical protein ADUPG1_013058 [Aduncisulcus paluster]